SPTRTWTPTITPTNTSDPSCVIVGSVVPSSGYGFRGVAAVSANDVWAVGPQVEHWDGRMWSLVPTPYPPGTSWAFNGVAAVSANDLWAVGYNGDTYRTVVEHWNGSAWSVVPNPSLGTSSGLNGVAAVSANDLWAVGYYFDDSLGYQTLVEHWNGTSWSVV